MADAHVLAKGLLVITRLDSSSSVQNQASSPLKHSVEESETTLPGISQQRDDETEASVLSVLYLLTIFGNDVNEGVADS